jgi:alanyl-tRNA synthetase
MTARLYHDRPLDLTFEARVAEVKGKLVRLEATLFYPASGGQPHDTGFLGDARVTSVVEEGESVWHELDEDLALAPGTVVKGAIDGERRRDHREQHSGQHLLSAVLLELARVPTVAFHLGADVSTIDVAAERVSRDLLDRVERRCLDVIRRDVPVTATVFRGDDAQAQAQTLRKPPEAEAVSSPRGLRVVEIAGIDRDACCGTHVARTGELGLVKVLSSERGKKGETRLTFVVGGRALAALQARANVLDELAQALTTGFGDLPARLAKLQDAFKATRTEAKALRGELLGFRAQALVQEAKPLAQGGTFVAVKLAEGDPGDARFLAQKLTSLRADLVCAVAHEGEQATLVLARGAQAPALDLAAVLKAALGPLGGKGGGQGGLAQGAAPDGKKAQEALDAVTRQVAHSD